MVLINHIVNFFDEFGNMLFYKRFMIAHSFPIPFRECISLTCAIPNGLIQPMKSYISYGEYNILQPLLMLDGVELTDVECTN